MSSFPSKLNETGDSWFLPKDPFTGGLCFLKSVYGKSVKGFRDMSRSSALLEAGKGVELLIR